MGLSKEEIQRRANDEHVRYIKKHLCDKERDKPFVFISYKSDDWEIVLHDIVYQLVHEYGLNVYFDGSFDSHVESWTDQFIDNMERYNCKGVLAFVDNKYSTSYATLLELMYSQTGRVGRKKVIPIYIGEDKRITITGAEGDEDTGLGDIYAENEKKLFVETFNELKKSKKHKILKDSKFLFKDDRPLTKRICSEIVEDILKHLNTHDKFYRGSNSDLESICDTIRNTFGNEVFSPQTTIEKAEDIEEPKDKKGGRPEKQEVIQEESDHVILPEPPKPASFNITESTTLKEFFTMCESSEVCLALREAREHTKKQFFDYMMAALLRGCDEKAFKLCKGIEQKLILAKWNYCTYAVSRNYDPANPKCGSSQFTWTSNARKAVGIEGSGMLGDNSVIFSGLSETETLGTIRQKFVEGKKAGFITKDNQQVLAAFDALFQIREAGK